jgi:hypothetical protein
MLCQIPTLDSIKCIFLAKDYPNLYELCLFNIEEEKAMSFFNGEIFHFEFVLK